MIFSIFSTQNFSSLFLISVFCFSWVSITENLDEIDHVILPIFLFKDALFFLEKYMLIGYFFEEK